MGAKRIRITPNTRRSNKMGEIVKSRKRHHSDYQKVEDDIEFLIDVKRPKLCSTDASDDRSSPDILMQIKDIDLDSAKGEKEIKLTEKKKLEGNQSAAPTKKTEEKV